MQHQITDRRITQACRLIEQSIKGPVDYTAIADVLGLSVYRFHHRFADELGETPGEYLRRIRLDTAALRLRLTRDHIGQCAADVGYDSQPSFNKAFARHFGLAPTEFRRACEGRSFGSIETSPPARVKFSYSRGFTVLARRYVGAPCFAADYWRDFLWHLPPELERQHRLFIGLLRDDMYLTPPGQCRYDCCVSVTEGDLPRLKNRWLWPHFALLSLPAGRCASITCTNSRAGIDVNNFAQSLNWAYSCLFDVWMTQRRHRLAGEYVIEVYSAPPVKPLPPDLKCTLLAPIIPT